MKHSIPQWQTAGFLFASVFGTFLHFLFDITGGSILAALFSAVNESIWEHMKLLFYPMAVFALVEYFTWGKEVRSFWCIKLCGVLPGLMLIPVIYYTYTGILGVSADWFNIAIFFLAAGIAYYTETRLFGSDIPCSFPPTGCLAILLGIAVLFTVLTFFPPRIPFFRDPITDTYGFHPHLSFKYPDRGDVPLCLFSVFCDMMKKTLQKEGLL